MVTQGSGIPPLPHGRESGGFNDYGKRLIFLEHKREDQTYDYSRLQAIADVMNDRTRRGVWCPIVVGHTDKYNKSELPVVGYFGDFQVSENAGPDGEAGIYARQYISKRYPNVAEDYPRLSVEIWPHDNILDPVSLLGGSTPYFDLPLLSSMNYERPKGDPVAYEVTTASGGNTMIPLITQEECESDKYMHNEDTVNQMLQALWPMMEKKIDEHLSDRMNVPDQGAVSTPEDSAVSGDVNFLTRDELTGEAAVDDLPAAGKADMETEEIKTSTGPDSMDESKDFRKSYMREQIGKKAKLDDGVDQLVAYAKGLDEDDLSALNAVLAEDAPEGLNEFYEKASKCLKPEEEASDDEGDDDDEKEKYRRERDDISEKYRRVRNDLDAQKQSYARLESENETLRKENDELKSKAVYERRRSDLAELAKTYALNPDSELEDAADMTDSQWERHVDKIRSNYQRVPDAQGVGALGVPPAEGDEAEKNARYHKTARAHCEAIVQRTGAGADYNKVYERVRATDGSVTVDQLLSEK